ncbi:MAG TPA: TlpA disulfide reductase family protein, partial [Candidatus Acidoferrum sp.]|nr:TlpA disulfide reductase family protein [Candidatus Acidoferrum sp.]
MRTLLVLAFAAFVPVWAQTFPTGDPVMPNSSGGMHPLTPAEYKKFAAAAKGHSKIVVIAKLPPKLSPDYRFGYNFVYELTNHGWILDRDSDGYVLYLDRKGDGDLSAAEPLRFHDEGGVPRIDVAMQDSAGRWTDRFEVAKAHSGPDGTEETVLRMNDSTTRSGVVELDGHRIPFRLSGSSGRYDLLGRHVAFDREGNGKFESYKPSDRWVNLAGKTYEFHIDPQGAFLTLKESDSRAERPSLKNGTPMPDVSLTDLEDKVHALRKGSSDLTLVEFWNTNCGPCREEMPLLRKLFDQTPRDRFDILGVTSDDSLETLQKYLAEFSIAWPECREPDSGPVHEIMRVEGIPAY